MTSGIYFVVIHKSPPLQLAAHPPPPIKKFKRVLYIYNVEFYNILNYKFVFNFIFGGIPGRKLLKTFKFRGSGLGFRGSVYSFKALILKQRSQNILRDLLKNVVFNIITILRTGIPPPAY